MTSSDMKAIKAWDLAAKRSKDYSAHYAGFDDYHDYPHHYAYGGVTDLDRKRYEMDMQLQSMKIGAKRKAEALAAEMIAQAMLSPGHQVVISNPGSTNNPAHLTINGQTVGPTAATMYATVGSGSTVSTNYNTAWTNLLINGNQWANATWDNADYIQPPQVISISDDGRIELPKGRQVRMPLGDGSILYVDKEGNFSVNDKDSKVIYKANRIREFNPYINASDLLIKFMDYVRGLGLDLKKEEVMSLDIGLFVNWLIIEAAERDSDPVPQDVVEVQQKRLKGRVSPRCILPTCRRFIPRAYVTAQFPFCNPMHAEAHIKRLKAA